MNVSADVADGYIVKIQKGGSVITSGKFVSGKVKIALQKAAATPGLIDVIVCNDAGTEVAAASINVVAYNPAIWTLSIGQQSNSVIAQFNANIDLSDPSFGVKVNGVTVPGANTSAVASDGKSFIISGVMFGGGGQFDIKPGDKFEITGIRLPELFPDYTFTYRTVFE